MAAKKKKSASKGKPTKSAPASVAPPATAQSYEHSHADLAARPEAGTQAQFRKKKVPKTYRYDSSLAPELTWDGGNAAVRDRAEELLRVIEAGVVDGSPQALQRARDAAQALRAVQEPFLNWAGKAERLSFDVATLPLFVHERLSTEAILDTLTAHKKDPQVDLFDLFADPRRPVADQVLRAYEHRDRWTNRMILGDSLVVMNSLLQYEGMGGQVQMIYIDPPYGVKFGSNFQPFVRKRDVKASGDEDLTREPEMVQAYRDTWELGLHSYLTYIRDRLLLAKDLLTPSGSVFVQISDENLHHVREVMDEVFGAENRVALIAFAKTTSATANLIATTADYLLWYARDGSQVKYRPLYRHKVLGGPGATDYYSVQLADGSRRAMTDDEIRHPELLPSGSRIFTLDNITSPRPAQAGDVRDYTFEGRSFAPGKGTFKTDRVGMDRLVKACRVATRGSSLRYVRFLEDFSVVPITDIWTDTLVAGARSGEKLYVVQTSALVVRRCLLMTTDPGDLILDPTCGSGTSAYVAEQWGRRWITIDTSRVPMALARQRLLTATFSWYTLKDDARGPAGGFDYQHRQNSKGEEIGGLVPHVTLGSIANDEPPTMEVLVDRPEEDRSITRVSGPFAFEATIPTPVDWEGDGVEDSSPEMAEAHGSFVDRMLEVLRRSPKIHIGGNASVQLEQVRAPGKTLVLNAEARLAGTDQLIAFVFGPEHGAVAEPLVYQALREAHMKSYAQLFVIGFGIDPHARKLVDEAEASGMPKATYVQATPDVTMGELLKTMRASQVFSVCGLPEIELSKVKPKDKSDSERWQVKLTGLDTFDPVTMETRATAGNDVPAWFLDHDYNGRVFRVCQAFFPRTGAWDAMKRALRADFEESLFDHLAGDLSAPFIAGDNRRVAVKVIDERGNELMVTKPID